MYINLQAEMVRNNIKRKDFADFLGVRQATICDKINGKYGFKLCEAFKIKEKFFPGLTIEYLFKNDEAEKKKVNDK